MDNSCSPVLIFLVIFFISWSTILYLCWGHLLPGTHWLRYHCRCLQIPWGTKAEFSDNLLESRRLWILALEWWLFTCTNHLSLWTVTKTIKSWTLSSPVRLRLLGWNKYILHKFIFLGGSGAECYGLNVPPWNSYVKAIPPKVVVVGGGAFVRQLRSDELMRVGAPW